MRIHHAVAAALLLGTCTAWAEQSVDRKVAADPNGEVEISTVSGSINVSGWDRNEVQVTGTLGDGVERLDFESSGKHTYVKVIFKHHGRWNDDETELEIRVPRGSSVDADTVSADLTVGGIKGSQRLQTVSGDINTDVAQQDAEVRTVSGELSVRGDNTPMVLSVTTVSGDANVSRVSGEVTATTVSGSLELAIDKLSRGRLRTTSGDAKIVTTLNQDGRLDAETISGELEVTLKGKLDAEFDIETFSGDIDNCFGPEARSTDKYGPGKELNFTQGSGSGRVRLSTLSGEVRLCNR
jgi:DUF4097 and DUF4098 domain-containing protein YvlB